MRGIGFGYIHYAVYIEGDFFAVCRPVFVAEAVGVSAVLSCLESVITRRDCVGLCLECSRRLLDLNESVSKVLCCKDGPHERRNQCLDCLILRILCRPLERSLSSCLPCADLRGNILENAPVIGCCEQWLC